MRFVSIVFVEVGNMVNGVFWFLSKSSASATLSGIKPVSNASECILSPNITVTPQCPIPSDDATAMCQAAAGTNATVYQNCLKYCWDCCIQSMDVVDCCLSGIYNCDDGSGSGSGDTDEDCQAKQLQAFISCVAFAVMTLMISLYLIRKLSSINTPLTNCFKVVTHLTSMSSGALLLTGVVGLSSLAAGSCLGGLELAGCALTGVLSGYVLSNRSIYNHEKRIGRTQVGGLINAIDVGTRAGEEAKVTSRLLRQNAETPPTTVDFLCCEIKFR